MLTVSLSEASLPVSAEDISVTDGSATVPAGTVSHDSDTITVTMDDAGRQAVAALSHPRSVAISAGALQDAWGNSNGAAESANIEYDDAAPPAISSASYATSSGVLTVSLSEASLPVSAEDISVTDGSATVPAGTVSHDSGTITVTMDDAGRQAVAALSHPRSVAISAGALQDAWGNSNGAAESANIEYDDAAPPAISSATYDMATGTLSVVLSEAALPVGQVLLSGSQGDISVSVADHASGSDSFEVALSGDTRTDFESVQQGSITMPAGTVSDIWNNSNQDDLAADVSRVGDVPDPEPPPDEPVDFVPGPMTAAYNLETKILSVQAPAIVISVDMDLIILHDDSSSMNVKNPTQVRNVPFFVIPFSSDDQSQFLALDPPRHVTVLPGGFTYLATNATNPANVTATITYVGDIAPPGMESATYDVSSGDITVRFTKQVSSIDVGKIALDGTSVNLDADNTSSAADSLTISLAGSDRDEFVALNPPRSITIDSGGITDTSGVGNDISITSTIQYAGDATPPDVLLVRYDNSSHSLLVTLSEPVLTPAAGSIRVAYQNDTASPEPIHTTHTDSFTLRLETATDAPLPVSVTVQAGSLTDIWGNANPQAVTGEVSRDTEPVTPPPSEPPIVPPVTPAVISSAIYDIDSGTLNATLTENILAILEGKIFLGDGSGELSGGVPAGSLSYANGTSSFAVTLDGGDMADFVSLSPPRHITITSGGLVDTGGRINLNNITGAVQYAGDATPPDVLLARYDNSSHSLLVTLSEPVLTPAAGSIRVAYQNDTASPEPIHTTHTDSFTLRLETATDAPLPVSVTVQAGSLTDIWGNANPDAVTVSLAGPAPPTTPPPITPITISSATYNVTSGTLRVTLTDNILTLLAGRIHLGELAGGVSADSLLYANGTDSFAIALTGSEKSRFVSMPAPRAVTISSGGLVDNMGRVNMANITGTISYTDTASPSIESASYNATSGAILVKLSEPVAAPLSDKMRLSGPAGEAAVPSMTHDTDEFQINLNGTSKAAFERLGTPAYVVVMPGGLADAWGNSNAGNLTESITLYDTTPPSLRAATYNATSNTLTVSFDEAISSPAMDKIRVTGPGGSAIALGAPSHRNDSFTVSPAGSPSGQAGATLDRPSLDGPAGQIGAPLQPTRITISPGGISDVSNNTNTGTLTRTIDVAGPVAAAAMGAGAIPESSMPALGSLTYDTDGATFILVFASDVWITDIELKDSLTTIDLGIDQNAHSGSAISIQLNSTAKASFESLSHPRSLVVPAQNMHDLVNQGNTNAADLSYSINYTDKTPPTISSAIFDTSDVLNITLSERLASYDYTKIVIPSSEKSAAIQFSATDFTYDANGFLHATLNGVQKASLLNDPRNVTILENGITDLWNNQNPADITHTISYTGDTAPPAIRSAAYATGTGVLTLTLSEEISRYDSAKITLYDSTRTGNVTFSAGDFQYTAPGTLTTTLGGNAKSSFEGLGHPRNIEVESGGVADLWSNQNAAPLTAAVSYDIFAGLRGADAIDIVTISGKTYALVASNADDSIQVIDVTNPASPRPVVAVFDGAGGFGALDGVTAVATEAISGKTYALATSLADDAMQVIDISTPTHPIPITAIFNGAGFTNLNDPRSVDTATISGKTYAIIASAYSKVMAIINVTNPASPDTAATVTGTLLDSAQSVKAVTISGKIYALVTSPSKASVLIVNITDPASPTTSGFARYGQNGFTELIGAHSVDTATISGKTYAIVASFIDDGVAIIDITDPASPTPAATITNGQNGFTALNSPKSVDTVTISGKTYALVASDEADAMQIINVTNPASPAAVAAVFDGQNGFTALDGAVSVTTVTASGKTYALVASSDDNAVQVIDITNPRRARCGSCHI